MYDVCARSKATKHSFNKIYKFRGNKLRANISVDFAVFVNFPSLDTSMSWDLQTMPRKDLGYTFMKNSTEFAPILKGFNFVQLQKSRAEIEHYHAGGGKKFISQGVF